LNRGKQGNNYNTVPAWLAEQPLPLSENALLISRVCLAECRGLVGLGFFPLLFKKRKKEEGDSLDRMEVLWIVRDLFAFGFSRCVCG